MDAISLVVLLLGVTTVQCMVCKNNTDCNSGECCYIRPEFEVVSRRRQLTLPLQPEHMHHDTGVCNKYRVEHDFCGPLEQANGHCGCGPGLSCGFVPAPTAVLATFPLPVAVQTTKTRRSIYMPGPGSFQCVKK